MPTRLTRREYEVALLVGEGLTNREIVERLGVSDATVRRHLENIRKKLNVRNRVGIAVWVTREMGAAA